MPAPHDEHEGPEAAGLRDFWALYDELYDALNEVTLEAARAHPQFAAVVAMRSAEQLRVESEASRERMRAAALGDWGPYEADLRAQGAGIAAMGVDFAGWYDLVRAYTRHLVPVMVERFAGEPQRLSNALLAMQRFVDRAMSTLAESYFEAKEARIRDHEAAAEASRARIEATEAALVRSEQRFSCLWTSGVVGITIETLEGLVIDANDAFLELHGHSRSDLEQGRVDWRHVPSPTRELALDELRREGVARPWEHELTLSDGKRVSTLVGAAMLADDSVISIVVDNSERKRLEELRARSFELEAQNRRVLEASRLKSEFLANMSHELRTPLNSIIGFAELLFDGEVGELADQQREFIGDILTSGRHLLQLINDVLDLSKVEAGKMDFRPEELDPRKPIQEVISLLRTQAAIKHIAIAVFIDPALETIFLDSGRFKQVLYNYLSNALKFSNDDGKVTVRLRAEGSDCIRLEVEDDGPGVAPQDVAKLFVEFSQLDPGRAKHHQGTGLGLALTRRLVEAQGGRVGVESEPGKGSTFHAVLPRRAVGTAALPQHRSHRSPAEGAPRVLVVEDDPDDQAQIVGILAGAGYSVDTAATVGQALALLREWRYDAITLDLILPDRSGVELLAELHEEHVDVPVVVITVITDNAVAGFVVEDILQKPIGERRLLAALGRAGVRPEDDGPVFIVDDDPASLRLMTATLERMGYELACFESGEKALAACEHLRPSGVVLDLLMPGMDGFQFLELFRRRSDTKRVPVLLWTVKELTDADWRRLERGIQAVVPKASVTGEALAGALRPFLPPPRAFGGDS